MTRNEWHKYEENDPVTWPEKEGNYLVSLTGREVSEARWRTPWKNPIDGTIAPGTFMRRWSNRYAKVLAWMPLPDPYNA